jgi:hypothetical protein
MTARLLGFLAENRRSIDTAWALTDIDEAHVGQVDVQRSRP